MAVIADIVKPVLDGIVANPAQVGLGIALIASVLYWRKAMGAASMMQAMVARMVFAAALMGLLLLSGVIPRLRVDLLISYVTGAFWWLVDLLRDIGVSLPF